MYNLLRKGGFYERPFCISGFGNRQYGMTQRRRVTVTVSLFGEIFFIFSARAERVGNRGLGWTPVHAIR